MKPATPLEVALWIGALAAEVEGVEAHLEGVLVDLVVQLLRRDRPRARA